MLDLDRLTRPEPPWARAWAAPTDAAVDAVTNWERADPLKRVGRVIRGQKAANARRFFDEAAAALQFPAAFGENWDALADALRDWRRFGDAAVVVCVTHADRLLASTTAAVAKTFTSMIADVLSEMNNPHRPHAMHILFQAPPDRRDAMIRRWKSAGLELQ